MKRCDVEDAELEQVNPEGTILKGCEDCVSALTGNSVESVRNEEAAIDAASLCNKRSSRS
jgi:hypothetical protein